MSENRLPLSQILALARCVRCGLGGLSGSVDGVQCRACGEEFPSRGGRPVLLRSDNALFPRNSYLERNSVSTNARKKPRLAKTVLRAIPGRSVNLARERVLRSIRASLAQDAGRVLVVGSGSQAQGILREFRGTAVCFAFCDIDMGGDVDLFCDAHELPFADNCFDGVITTAVLEHVLRPELVAQEIARVVRTGGFLYSEVPFLQAVHMGAYDFTRYTLSGHRRLHEGFSEVSAGVVAGPGTALLWALEGFGRSLFQSARRAKLAALGIRAGFAWVKQLDRYLVKNPAAWDYASATYFYGRKTGQRTHELEIVARYGADRGR